MNVRELQSEAKALEKKDPNHACELYKQALGLDKDNRVIISGYGRSLRAASRAKEFVELCDEHEDKTLLEDKNIQFSYCWCA